MILYRPYVHRMALPRSQRHKALMAPSLAPIVSTTNAQAAFTFPPTLNESLLFLTCQTQNEARKVNAAFLKAVSMYGGTDGL